MSIKIRPITMDDFPDVLQWSQDSRFCTANGWDLNRKPEELSLWWERLVNHPPSDFIRLGIEHDQKMIGYVDFADVTDQSAEFGIAIGESKLWGKGIGFQASLSALDYANQNLGITTFLAETHETNLRSRRLLERIGFQEFSRTGSEIYKGQATPLIQLRFNYKRGDNHEHV